MRKREGIDEQGEERKVWNERSEWAFSKLRIFCNYYRLILFKILKISQNSLLFPLKPKI